MLEKLMAEFQKDLGIEGSLAGDAPGTFVIPVSEEAAVVATPQPIGFSLHCDVIQAPKANEEMFLEKALRANLFGQGTEGAILGLSEDGNLLTLTRSIDYNPDYKSFKDILEDFLNSVDFWREEVLNHNKNS